jgi:GT2 family glycosyltransferase/SAM-dependent methyltransferase
MKQKAQLTVSPEELGSLSASYYGPEYYRCCCGRLPYERNGPWLGAFANIAKQIQVSLCPRTVLDAGCAMGMLVEALWDLGIRAQGLDVSTYAISQVRRDMAAHCRVGSVTDPIEGRWDLIVCIEVLEHVTAKECDAALGHFARATDQVLFSSTPLDLTEETHINVKPIRAWLESFASHGFYPVTDYDATYISPQSMLLRRGEPVPENELELFSKLVMTRCLLQEKSRALLESQALQERAESSSQSEELRRLSTDETATGRLNDLISKLQAERLAEFDQSGAEHLRRHGEMLEHALQMANEVRTAYDNRLRAQVCELHAALADRDAQLTHRLEESRHLAAALTDSRDSVARLTEECGRVTRELASAREATVQYSLEIARLQKREADIAQLHQHSGRLQEELAESRRAGVLQAAEVTRLKKELGEVRSEAAMREQRGLLENSRTLKALAAARRDLRQTVASAAPRRETLLLRKETARRLASAFATTLSRRLRALRLSRLEIEAHARAIAPLMDLGTYCPEGKGFNSQVDAARHYLLNGYSAGTAPNPLFDAKYYLDRYPDVENSAINPLLHYALFGYAEGRQPGPLFDADWYRVETDSPVGAGNELAHFLASRGRESSPYPLFDCAHFLRQCPAARHDPRHPFLYYLTEASAWGLSPHPLFDGEYYGKQIAETSEAGTCPLRHFILEGARLGLNPHPLFDVIHYKNHCPEAGDPWTNPLLHFVEHGAKNMLSPHPLFDPDHYCSQHVPTSELCRNPVLHYLACPPAMRKSPHPDFDIDRYVEQNADRMGLGEDPLSHYIRSSAPRESGSAPAASNRELAVAAAVQVPADSVPDRKADVSIIVAIHNALDDVKRCLSSVIRHTLPPYELIVVDDGSNDEVRMYLQEFSAEQGAMLLRNDDARGYTLAANQGMRASGGQYVVLLNSDTIVTETWLDRLVACAESDPFIGLVGPLSNTASWQSVPELFENGDWASNPPPEGVSIDEISSHVASCSGRVYPRIRFLNGFCLVIRRAAMDGIGLFDEETFGAGYGEENDFCVRALKNGWQAAVADDTYVFHAQSKSYSSERRLQLAKRADVNLRSKHGDEIVDRGIHTVRNSLPLLGARARVKASFERAEVLRAYQEKYEGRRVAFVLPVCDAGGGANVILSEASAMRRFGVDARIINLSPYRRYFEQSYGDHRLQTMYATDELGIAPLCEGFDAVVATLYKSVFWLADVARHGKTTVGYYVQDYEPYFFGEGTLEHGEAMRSYGAYEGLRCLTKTEWNRDQVLQNAGVRCEVVGASMNTDLFQPRNGTEDGVGPVRILAMVRPESPRRAAMLTVEVLNRLVQRHGARVEVTVFGTDLAGYASLGESNFRKIRRYGKLRPEQCASLFASQDVFLDFSQFQAMGLTAMECMASGCAVVVPERGGSGAFAVHGQNALIAGTSNPESCFEAANRLVEDTSLRNRLRMEAVASMPGYFPERSAGKLLDALFHPVRGQAGR